VAGSFSHSDVPRDNGVKYDLPKKIADFFFDLHDPAELKSIRRRVHHLPDDFDHLR
jgi:hypothetical protein